MIKRRTTQLGDELWYFTIERPQLGDELRPYLLRKDRNSWPSCGSHRGAGRWVASGKRLRARRAAPSSAMSAGSVRERPSSSVIRFNRWRIVLGWQNIRSEVSFVEPW